jgi:hypothetical protein
MCKTANKTVADWLYCDIFQGRSKRPMRYALSISDKTYLAACYEATGSGILLTEKAEDACSYVTIEKALAVAKAVAPSVGELPCIVEVNY